MSDSRSLVFLKGLLIGGLIGAVAGILFAPKSGRETREDISRKTQDLVSKAREEYVSVLEKSKEAYDAALERMKETKSALKGQVSETEKKIEEWAEKGKDAVDETKGRFKRALDAGIEAYKEEKEKP